MANYQLGSLQHDSNLYKHFYLQVVGNSTCLLFFVFLLQFLAAHQHINRLRVTSTNLLLIGKFTVLYSHVVLLSFSFNSYNYFATSVHFIKFDRTVELIFEQRLLLYFKLLLIKVQQKRVFKKYSSFIQIYQQLPRFQKITIC